VKCILHHPRSRPIRQHKLPECRYGARCTNKACPFPHPEKKAVVESKEAAHPCGLSFSDLHTNVVLRQPHRLRARSTPRCSNRIIVRSPMVVPSSGGRPTGGYFAATTKPCVNGAACLKYGCTYKHPASRVADCPLGLECEDANCAQLHPLNVHGMGAVAAGFAVGQNVQARYLPNSTKWSDATIRRIRGSALTLQFIGFDDVFEVPLQRVRHPRNAGPNYSHTPVSPCPLTAPPSPSLLSDLKQLECLKQAAVAREDFIVAEQIKQRIAKVKKITELQNQKQAAVHEENFMLAMQLKQQIDELENNDAAPAPATTHRRVMESSAEQSCPIEVK